MSKTILIKIASRERPEQLLKTVEECIRLASDTSKLIWLFSFDEDDKSCWNGDFTDEIIELIDPSRHNFSKSLLCVGNSKNKIHAINRDVNRVPSCWQILLNLSDDQRPIVKGWDEVIRKAMLDSLDASLWYSDGSQRINTMEIIGRTYYERFGYIYHPDFKSLWCDNLATDLALFQGKCIRSSQQLFDHLHPAWRKPNSLPMDDLYRRNQKYWDEDKATYNKLVRNGLDKLIPKA